MEREKKVATTSRVCKMLGTRNPGEVGSLQLIRSMEKCPLITSAVSPGIYQHQTSCSALPAVPGSPAGPGGSITTQLPTPTL